VKKLRIIAVQVYRDFWMTKKRVEITAKAHNVGLRKCPSSSHASEISRTRSKSRLARALGPADSAGRPVITRLLQV
jgi:hypothetical protein